VPTTRRVYIAFELRTAWHVTFTEVGRQTPLARTLTFMDSEKIIELTRRGGHAMNLEGRQALEMGISNGRGGVTLQLTPEQYGKLNMR
jgi:hypothetical protein